VWHIKKLTKQYDHYYIGAPCAEDNKRPLKCAVVSHRELNVYFSTLSCLQHRFREFGSMSNWPHNRRPHVWRCVGKWFADANIVNRVKISGTTFHGPQSTAWSTLCERRCVTRHEANGGHTRYGLIFWSMPPLNGTCNQQIHIYISSHVKSID
jgi:hypothetical protein